MVGVGWSPVVVGWPMSPRCDTHPGRSRLPRSFWEGFIDRRRLLEAQWAWFGVCGCICVLCGQGPMFAALGQGNIALAASGERNTDAIRWQLGLACGIWTPQHMTAIVPAGDRGHCQVLPSATAVMRSSKCGLRAAFSVLCACVAFGVGLRNDISLFFCGFRVFCTPACGHLEAFGLLRL